MMCIVQSLNQEWIMKTEKKDNLRLNFNQSSHKCSVSQKSPLSSDYIIRISLFKLSNDLWVTELSTGTHAVHDTRRAHHFGRSIFCNHGTDSFCRYLIFSHCQKNPNVSWDIHLPERVVSVTLHLLEWVKKHNLQVAPSNLIYLWSSWNVFCHLIWFTYKNPLFRRCSCCWKTRRLNECKHRDVTRGIQSCSLQTAPGKTYATQNYVFCPI